MTGAGKLWGVGLGPGDPELVTVKAARVITDADVIAFHSARHGNSISRGIAAPYMRPGQLEEHLVYPVTTETTDHPGGYEGAISEFYTEAAERLAAHLSAGRNVALLAEGDPLFYSSYMHMHKRLSDRFAAEVIPGITSVSAASAALGTPLVEGEQVLTVLPGTMPEAELRRRLRDTDAAAVMKLGRGYAKVQRALADAGRLDQAMYVERASTDRERVVKATDVGDDVPYFSIVVVPGAQQTTVLPTGGEVTVVGLGPGDEAWTTPETRQALSEATDLVGYGPYLDRVPTRPGQRRHASDNRVESERAEMALDFAKRGARVVVVSSGDPGVFAMATAVLEIAAQPQWQEVPVRVLPGMTAANAVASRAGAPLGHDYAVISLSDRLKPWETVSKRVTAAAAADLVLAIYNPASRSRRWQVSALRDLVLEHRAPATPVIVGRDVGGVSEWVSVTTLGELDPDQVDMRTMLIIGSSRTTVVQSGSRRPIVYTPRHY